ncbi:MAG: hypothetical protein A3I38_03640 [Candidatus Wildermuthbacteria bacterium RIFCSPLOWO2_02_FULL_47_10]|uniref:Uncharacterized protein n=1 Tax=Candidatus Wildermuthbacteria bacterium RIFCSPLOWO2_01_FULL_48_35 TaxID=1802463 RepID=A0A1G2RP95_9BACT|nr:MAG: hypothetical protein A3A32_02960 [Candidatus Wildermuthbacteria bacterium RIFCSPLOWO2_01_FULL_48_35]OHA76539.1 MAG: hypothetical protein A3I38_03640 [Candidatus Wildermuthbacteria bacterium RIFCSPLOWO2_02_FULL_47_10]
MYPEGLSLPVERPQPCVSVGQAVGKGSAEGETLRQKYNWRLTQGCGRGTPRYASQFAERVV